MGRSCCSMAGAATDGPLDASWLELDTKTSSKCVGVRVDFAARPYFYPVSVGGCRTETAARSVIPSQVQVRGDLWVKTEGRTKGQLTETGWLIH